MAWFSNWTQKHYIQNIENFKLKKNSWKFPKYQRNFHCIEFDKLNAMEIAWNFLGFSRVFWNFEIFNVLNVMFLRSVWKSRHGNCVHPRINAISMAWFSNWTQYLIEAIDVHLKYFNTYVRNILKWIKLRYIAKGI